MEMKLNHCRVCGSEAEFITDNCGRHFAVACSNQKCGKSARHWWGKPENAVSAWNNENR